MLVRVGGAAICTLVSTHILSCVASLARACVSHMVGNNALLVHETVERASHTISFRTQSKSQQSVKNSSPKEHLVPIANYTTGKTRQSDKLRRRPRRTSAARRAGSSTMALLLDLAEKAPIGPRKNTCDSREGERELRANALRRRGIAAGALRVARTWPFSTVSASNHLKPPTAARGSGQKSSIRAISSCYTTHKRGISGRGLG